MYDVALKNVISTLLASVVGVMIWPPQCDTPIYWEFWEHLTMDATGQWKPHLLVTRGIIAWVATYHGMIMLVQN